MKGVELVKVKDFICLGSSSSSNGQYTRALKKRVHTGWRGWRGVPGVISDKRTSKRPTNLL